MADQLLEMKKVKGEVLSQVHRCVQDTGDVAEMNVNALVANLVVLRVLRYGENHKVHVTIIMYMC